VANTRLMQQLKCKKGGWVYGEEECGEKTNSVSGHTRTRAKKTVGSKEEKN